MDPHFEVFHGEADRMIGESSGAVGWLWRFIDGEGHERASDRDRAHETPEEAAVAVAELVQGIRVATYGQRFDAAITTAVRIVDA